MTGSDPLLTAHEILDRVATPKAVEHADRRRAQLAPAPVAAPACDPLTGLPAHARLLQLAHEAVARATRHGWSTALLVIDVDDFRQVNRLRGHQVGDAILIELAARLSDAFRASDGVGCGSSVAAATNGAVGRFGGDRFVAVCEDVVDAAAACALAERVHRLLEHPVRLADRSELAVTVGIGIAVGGPSGPSAEQRICDGEAALRTAKRRGPRQREVVDERVVDHREVHLARARALQDAIDGGELVLHYQPKVSFDCGRITGVEALVRWLDPARGLIPPLEFIPLAEQTGLIVPLGSWVIRQACKQAAEWQRQLPQQPPLVVSVNVAGPQLGPDLVAVVADALAASGVAAGQLCLELTESTLITDLDAAVETILALAALGVRLSIDDFGTGYSSLSYLKCFPLHELKIDRSFVGGLGVDARDTTIIAATVAMAHALGLNVIAEGVETVDQLERLRVMGCREVQGYYLSRPVPASTVTRLLDDDGHRGWRWPTARSPAAPTGRFLPDRILLVNDTEDAPGLARMSLVAAGFDVHDAAGAAQGIEVARQLQPDCIILDVSLPGMSGIEACRALRRDPTTARCTILMLTCETAANDRMEAFSSGVDDCILKPSSPRDLVARVRAALGRPSGGPIPSAARLPSGGSERIEA